MAQQNIDVIRTLFDAYAREDNDTLRQVLAEDVVYHIPGRNPLSGDYRGRERGAYLRLGQGASRESRQRKGTHLARRQRLPCPQ